MGMSTKMIYVQHWLHGKIEKQRMSEYIARTHVGEIDPGLKLI